MNKLKVLLGGVISGVTGNADVHHHASDILAAGIGDDRGVVDGRVFQRAYAQKFPRSHGFERL